MPGAISSQPTPCERVFLGWDGALLERAATWLHGDACRSASLDLARVLLVVPSERAGRTLLVDLARRFPPDWVPPRSVIQSQLAQVLGAQFARPGHQPATPWAQSAAWRLAFSGLERSGKAHGRGSQAAKQRRVARLWSELQRACVGVEHPVLARSSRPLVRTLCEVVPPYLGQLEQAGVHDPLDLARRALIEPAMAPGPDAVACIVLVGIGDLTPLARALLGRFQGRVVTLVAAPPSHSERFDALGMCQRQSWPSREPCLESEHWRAAQGPDQVAELFCNWLQGHQRRDLASTHLGLAVLDPDLQPYLARGAARAGFLLQQRASAAWSECPVGSWLHALSSWLASGAREPWSELLRHAHVSRALEHKCAARPGDLPAWIDEDHVRHLQAATRADLPFTEQMRVVRGHLASLHRGLLDALPAPASAHAAQLRECAARLFEEGPSEDWQARWIWAHSLELLGRALDDITWLAGTALDETMTGAEFCALLSNGLEHEQLPAALLGIVPHSVQALDWQEVPCLGSGSLFLAGLADGLLPSPPLLEQELGPAVSADLGLAQAEERLARDAYYLEWLQHSQSSFVAVSARAGSQGEPKGASRLVFAAPIEELAKRVEQFFHPDGGTPPDQGSSLQVVSQPAQPLPRDPGQLAAPLELRATSLRTFLDSPYQFYVKHVLRLECVDDHARELDGAQFGTLVHALLADFGRSPLAASDDQGAIADWLEQRSAQAFHERYAGQPWPALPVQFEQLKWRLRQFAHHQAHFVKAGWRIAKVEYAPPPLELDVDGQRVRIIGRIDRIDYHASQDLWRILDYKTGAYKLPYSTRSRAWSDLQLPLYGELMRPHLGKARLEVGLLWLVSDSQAEHLKCYPDGEIWQIALDQTRDCVRNMRRGEWFQVGRNMPHQWELAFLEARGAIRPPAAESEAGGDIEQVSP